MLKLKKTVWCQTFLLVLLCFCVAGWQSCTPINNNNQPVDNAATPPVKTASPNNSNSESSGDVKIFSRYFETEIFIDPPPTPGSGGRFAPIGDIQKRLKITSLKQTAIVLTPQRNSVVIESIELAIYSPNGEKLFALPAISVSKRRTFEPITEPTGSNIAGYVFDLDQARINEADKFFVPENTIKVIPVFGRERPATAIFYLVDKQSEVTKKD